MTNPGFGSMSQEQQERLVRMLMSEDEHQEPIAQDVAMAGTDLETQLPAVLCWRLMAATVKVPRASLRLALSATESSLTPKALISIGEKLIEAGKALQPQYEAAVAEAKSFDVASLMLKS